MAFIGNLKRYGYNKPMATAKKKVLSSSEVNDYKSFEKIDGRHPFKAACPKSFVDYPARLRPGGKLAFFNFDLAREIGLISSDHPDELNQALEQKILDTFGILIINEYDEMNNIEFPKDQIKPYKYMATRYLQLQHPNKKGLTSGDGRSVWNGCFKAKSRTWDLSSSGTGATKLSPATAIQNKFFKSGDESISYGCGYSEIDEGLATLFFSEVFHRNNIETERVLAIIEYPKGISINVRVHKNLLRPSHMFRPLKQDDYESLENVVEYYIKRQKSNCDWKGVPKTRKARLKYFLDKQTKVFAKLAANLEDHYIFCWLDWDGDNILMDGSIIDYGSVRQFGLFHHEYRYDDVQRYSTSILEQKQKAKYIVQTFAQIVDFLIHKKRRGIQEFSSHECLDQFDEVFEKTKKENLLYKIGLEQEDREFLLQDCPVLIESFQKPYNYFEMAKSKKGIEPVADGINCSAIYCMRDILREIPQLLLTRGEFLDNEEFLEIIQSDYISEEDLAPNSYRDGMIRSFQQAYQDLIEAICCHRKKDLNKVLLDISMRSSVINKYDRVTGDSITTIVEEVLKARPRPKSEEIYRLMREFVRYQNLDPDVESKSKPILKRPKNKKLFQGFLKIVRDYREGL